MSVLEQIDESEFQALEFRLSGMEEIAVACAAVTEVYGEDHPLLQPGDRTYGTSLWDKIQELELDKPEVIFSLEASAVIREALVKTADEESDSPHRVKAASMLGLIADFHTSEFDSLSIAPSAKPATVIAETEVPAAVSAKSRKLRIRQELALCSFGEIVAAKRAVDDFVGQDSALVTRRGETKDGRPSLIDAIDGVNPGRPEVWTFRGRDARVIRRALKSAAARDENVYDVVASNVLKRGDPVSAPARERQTRVPSQQRVRSAGSLALQ